MDKIRKTDDEWHALLTPELRIWVTCSTMGRRRPGYDIA
jgi:hypothetical protein